jgi:hypothetical protein
MWDACYAEDEAISAVVSPASHCRLSGAITGDATAVNARSGFTAVASLYNPNMRQCPNVDA